MQSRILNIGNFILCAAHNLNLVSVAENPVMNYFPHLIVVPGPMRFGQLWMIARGPHSDQHSGYYKLFLGSVFWLSSIIVSPMLPLQHKLEQITETHLSRVSVRSPSPITIYSTDTSVSGWLSWLRQAWDIGQLILPRMWKTLTLDYCQDVPA